MAFRALTPIASFLFGLRGFLDGPKFLFFIMVLSCATFSLVTREPCSIDGGEQDSHGLSFSGDNSDAVFPVFDSEYGNSNLDTTCVDSRAFCFPSTLPGLISEDSESEFDSSIGIASEEESETRSNKTWSLDYGAFKLFNGVVSCSLNLRDQTDSSSYLASCGGPLVDLQEEETGVEINHSSRDVEIYPQVLDWGRKYRYFPSVAFLTIANTCTGRVLHVYEPFSTDSQFYPCNFSQATVGPGETISICFVFLPTSFGSLSARLVLQTSNGGFVILAKGFAVESPYGIYPLLGHSALSGILGRGWNRNLSLSNSFHETLFVEEITAWLSVSIGHDSVDTEAICSFRKLQDSKELDFSSIEERLVVRNGQFGSPLIGMRPGKNWEIGPHSTETILEVDFSVESKGKVNGAFCMKLSRSSSREESDTVVVLPLKAGTDGKALVRRVSESISVSLEELYHYDAEEAAVAISIRNDAPYLLSVVKFTEVADTKPLHIKYMERLLLYPESDTQVAVASCSDVPNSEPTMHGNCKIVALTNDSTSPQIEVTCQEIIQMCLRHTWVGYKHRGTVSVDLPLPTKAGERSKAEELVLENWKSQGSKHGLSVVDGDEVVFPMVEVGSHKSEWISVKNPSEKPVIMQLILNSGEMIEKCKGTDGILHPPSSGSPSRYGFSISDTASTEAFVHPHETAVLGPILFRPSTRCEWRTRALLRNNLSGVEWISLKGIGGSVSLLLREEASQPVRGLEFNVSSECWEPVLKEVYAENTGDFPLEVRRIKVSGRDCGADGFKVERCGGFAIAPGEASKVVVSYRETQYSSGVVVHRDLELVLSSGIVVVPMKAVLGRCKRSRVNGYAVAVLAVSMLCCVVYLRMESETVEAEKGSQTTKKKKTKKKKKKGGNKLLEEVNNGSSQSGNSTPSSPLSPLTSKLTLTAAASSKLCHAGYDYDMWADHLPTIRSKMNSDSHSHTFFVNDPHSLFAHPNT